MPLDLRSLCRLIVSYPNDVPLKTSGEQVEGVHDEQGIAGVCRGLLFLMLGMQAGDDRGEVGQSYHQKSQALDAGRERFLA